MTLSESSLGKGGSEDLTLENALVYRAIFDYGFLGPVFEKLDDDERLSFIGLMQDFFEDEGSDPEGDLGGYHYWLRYGEELRRFDFLKAIFQKKEGNGLDSELNELYGSGKTGLNRAFHHKFMYQLVQILASEPDRYRFQIGAMMTNMDAKRFPPGSLDQLNAIETQNEMSVRIGNKHWSLCDSSEKRMNKSSKKDAVVVVNGLMLVKFKGIMTGLCLHSFTTRIGRMFVEGNWYSPVESDLRRSIRSAFDEGRSEISSWYGEWALMRAMKERSVMSPEVQLEKYRRYTEELPDQLPKRIGRRKRKAWRKKNKAGN